MTDKTKAPIKTKSELKTKTAPVGKTVNELDTAPAAKKAAALAKATAQAKKVAEAVAVAKKAADAKAKIVADAKKAAVLKKADAIIKAKADAKKAKADAKAVAKAVVDAKKAADAKEKADAKAAKDALPKPTSFTVTVNNTIGGAVSEIFVRTCEWEMKLTAMKGMRQKIRDLGTTIRFATVTDSPDGGTKVIDFTDLVITEKPKTVKTTSNARNKPLVQTAIDTEILGISSDQEAKPEDIVKALEGYTRHQLIHGYNVLHPDAKLDHFSKKVDAVAALANVKTADDKAADDKV